jgi:acyl dehydratase
MTEACRDDGRRASMVPGKAGRRPEVSSRRAGSRNEDPMSRYDDLLAFEFPEIEHSYTERDTILYALGVGLGSDPTDERQIGFVFEERLKALPTMASVLAYPGFWYRDLRPGLDFVRTVHASERIEIHRPLPPAATVVARNRVVGIFDKGPDRGSLVATRRDIAEKGTGSLLATVTQTAFCRGDGGLGGPLLRPPPAHAIPGRPADIEAEMPTLPQAALIYRLSGDGNPLHVDPAFAGRAGFPKPILHGLSTYGHIGHTILRSVCGYDPARIRTMDCRFVGVVFPGDTLRVRIWRDAGEVSFQALDGERVVVDNGLAELATDPSSSR